MKRNNEYENNLIIPSILYFNGIIIQSLIDCFNGNFKRLLRAIISDGCARPINKVLQATVVSISIYSGIWKTVTINDTEKDKNVLENNRAYFKKKYYCELSVTFSNYEFMCRWCRQCY